MAPEHCRPTGRRTGGRPCRPTPPACLTTIRQPPMERTLRARRGVRLGTDAPPAGVDGLGTAVGMERSGEPTLAVPDRIPLRMDLTDLERFMNNRWILWRERKVS